MQQGPKPQDRRSEFERATLREILMGARTTVGSWAGGVTGRSPWRDGLRLVLIAGAAALAAAFVGLILRID